MKSKDNLQSGLATTTTFARTRSETEATREPRVHETIDTCIGLNVKLARTSLTTQTEALLSQAVFGCAHAGHIQSMPPVLARLTQVVRGFQMGNEDQVTPGEGIA
jgi:hypothetical protein